MTADQFALFTEHVAVLEQLVQSLKTYDALWQGVVKAHVDVDELAVCIKLPAAPHVKDPLEFSLNLSQLVAQNPGLKQAVQNCVVEHAAQLQAAMYGVWSEVAKLADTALSVEPVVAVQECSGPGQ